MKVLITDHGFKSAQPEREIFAVAGVEVQVEHFTKPEEIIAAARDADALLVQWAPVNAGVIAALPQCKIIVRYGIGVDNVDIAAAKARGIPVCNVPDYCIHEVADHSLALALALARQLPQIAARVQGGTWKITPDRPMPAFGDMVFAAAGFGRIARAVLERAKVFGFKLAAYDPFVPEETFRAHGVTRLDIEDLFRQADVLSLHLPLTSATRHLVNAERLAQMKPNAIIINTARGGLIETVALAEALHAGRIGGAGLDVFETEPLPPDHPLRAAPNTVLTSHVAWYSEASVPQLQRSAAEEVVRGLSGKPLKNPVNQ